MCRLSQKNAILCTKCCMERIHRTERASTEKQTCFSPAVWEWREDPGWMIHISIKVTHFQRTGSQWPGQHKSSLHISQRQDSIAIRSLTLYLIIIDNLASIWKLKEDSKKRLRQLFWGRPNNKDDLYREEVTHGLKLAVVSALQQWACCQGFALCLHSLS